jgi:hypothetical protein
MKNIFILPTEKPSKLVLRNTDNKLVLHTLITKWNGVNQHIYITSDEYIDKDSWVIHDNKLMYLVFLRAKSQQSRRGALKIILTTDQNLIEDGVQAIDYDFLLWYIKNTSCEYVDVASELKAFDKNGFCVSSAIFEGDYTKNIYYIVPKVESKENPTTTIFRNNNRIIYNEDDLINFMQFIISQESLDNTSSVSKETARYYIEKFKNRQNEN